MNSFFRNTISKLYNAVSAPVAATRNGLSERMQSLHETASLLYNRMMGEYRVRTREIERHRRKRRSRKKKSQRATAKTRSSERKRRSQRSRARASSKNNYMMMSNVTRFQK